MRTNAILKLENLAHFTTSELQSVTGLKPASLKQFVARNIASQQLVRLKGGVYVTASYLNGLGNSEKIEYAEFVSSILNPVSYLSLEYVLAKHGVLTEAVYTFTAVTRGRPYRIENKLGSYSYRHSSQIYGGYEVVNFRGANYYIAGKVKALFDFIYFRSQLLPTNLKGIDLPAELRLNLEVYNSEELASLAKLAGESGTPKLINIVENIINNAPHS